MFDTPILLIAFNRPSETRRVLSVLKRIQPKQLFVAIDAPRENREDDKQKIQEVKNIIENFIDWPCSVEKLYQQKNHGAGYGPAAAITWFFSKVSAGIILEDDCVPDLSFFGFCEELLRYYQDNSKVMHISGNNYQNKKRGEYSYYFSKYPHNWGWATWARAWKRFNHSLILESERGHVWDAAWEKSLRKAGGLPILPQVNLVENIGFGENATHTKSSIETEFKAYSVELPLHHPLRVSWNIAADYYTFKHHRGFSLFRSLISKIKKYL